MVDWDGTSDSGGVWLAVLGMDTGGLLSWVVNEVFSGCLRAEL